MGKQYSVKKKSSLPLLETKTANQKAYLAALQGDLTTIATGCPGTGKTYMASIVACQGLIDGKYKKVVIARPAKGTEDDIGFEPGPQPYSAKVLTPAGWTTMGQIKPGDLVISRDGKPTKVLETFEKGSKTVYKINTLDGRSTAACLDHLWEVQENNKLGVYNKPKIVNTEYIKNNLLNKKGIHKIVLPDMKPLEMELKFFSIDPYVLGCLVGDGCLGDSIRLTSKDKEIINNCRQRLKGPVELTHSSGLNYIFKGNYEIRGRKSGNYMKEQLCSLGLLGKKAWEKFIPEDYKWGSINQRLDLLRGLMDTDGECRENGECNLTTTSEALAEDVKLLVYSLGGKAYITKRDRTGKKQGDIQGRDIISKRACYNVRITLSYNPFLLARKACRFRVKDKWVLKTKIASVEEIGEEPCKCILIDNPTHLYVTDDFIVTHNTMEEKMAGWVRPVSEVLINTLGASQYEARLGKTIELVPLHQLMGRSFYNTYVIVDEAQNMSVSTAMSLVTRTGKWSKLVLCGDEHQKVMDSQSGLSFLLDLIEDYQMDVNHIEFGIKDCVRSAECKMWLEVFSSEGLI